MRLLILIFIIYLNCHVYGKYTPNEINKDIREIKTPELKRVKRDAGDKEKPVQDVSTKEPEHKINKKDLNAEVSNTTQTLNNSSKKEEPKPVLRTVGKPKPANKTKAKSAGEKGKAKPVARGDAKKPKAKAAAKPAGKNVPAAKKANAKRLGPKKPKRNNGKNLKKKPAARGKTVKKAAPKGPARKGNATQVIKETRRLTAAKEAMIEDFPYVVSIQKDEEHWCSGALLSPRVVVTTANCVWKSKSISRMEVRACSSFTDHGGQVSEIQEVLKHPLWGVRKGPDNDIALLLLEDNIKFSDKCHSVEIPNHSMMPAFEDAWVASWGAERRDGIFEEHENIMQVYHTHLMSNETCNNITQRFGIVVTENFICFSQSGKTAPCTRDTGAPAVSDGVLWGLASWGIRKLCGTERFPAMFTYLASHSNMDFITNGTRHMMVDKRLYPFLDKLPRVKITRAPVPSPQQPAQPIALNYAPTI